MNRQKQANNLAALLALIVLLASHVLQAGSAEDSYEAATEASVMLSYGVPLSPRP